MKPNLLLQVVLICISTCIATTLLGQRSTDYDRANDLWISSFSDGQENVCKTSFTRHRIDSFIHISGTSYLGIGLGLKDSRNAFTLIAFNNANRIIGEIVGDYPCPIDCIPPEPVIIKEYSGTPAKGLNKIDIADIETILNLGPDVDLITIKKGLKWKGEFSYELSHFIYGVISDINQPNPQPRELAGPNDPVFISIQK